MMVKKRGVVGGVAAASATGAAIWAAPLAADPEGVKDCGPDVAKLAFDKVQSAAAAEPD